MDQKSCTINFFNNFSALRSLNYRWYISGMLVSVIGTWIQIIAMGWLVYQLTGSLLLLGLMGFLNQIPSLLITPFAGVFADRLNRKNIILATQIAAMALSLVLSLLVLTEWVQVWHLMIIAVCNGIVNAVDTPFRHAFVRDMIDEPLQLQNAIALNSTLFNMARFIGPAIGGFLIHFLGEGWCFFINGATFLAVIFSLLKMNIHQSELVRAKKRILIELKDGFHYSWNTRTIRYLLLLVIASGFFCLPFQAFLPYFAKDVLHGNSGLYGILTGSYGAGALAGALFLTLRKKIMGLPKIIFFASLLFSCGLMIFSWSHNIALSILILIPAGFGMITQFTSTNTLLQMIAEDDKVGRVISLYGISFMGITPLGTMLIGILSDYFDIQWILFGASFISLIFIAIFYFRRKEIDSTISNGNSNFGNFSH